MISKELLSQVLKEEVNESIILDGYIIKYSYKYLGYAEINIFELEHKCKEWALELGYRIIIDSSKDIKASIRILQNGKDIYQNENKQETQSVILACQWILDNKDK